MSDIDRELNEISMKAAKARREIQKQNALVQVMNGLEWAVEEVQAKYGLDPENKARFMLEARTAWNRLATLEGCGQV